MIVIYVSGVATIAYGGPDAPLGSAVAANGGSAAIALGVVWTPRAVTRHAAFSARSEASSEE
jgi:hypothetical protein